MVFTLRAERTYIYAGQPLARPGFTQKVIDALREYGDGLTSFDPEFSLQVAPDRRQLILHLGVETIDELDVVIAEIDAILERLDPPRRPPRPTARQPARQKPRSRAPRKPRWLGLSKRRPPLTSAQIRDIILGLLSSGQREAFSVKELAEFVDCNRQRLKADLDSLCAEGRLVAKGPWYDWDGPGYSMHYQAAP